MLPASATQRCRSPIFLCLPILPCLLFPTTGIAQPSELAPPYIVFESGSVVSGNLSFSRESLQHNQLSLDGKQYPLSDVLFFWDGQDYFGRTLSNLVLRRIAAGRIDLFADFEWTNVAGVVEPSGKIVAVGPRFVRKGYYSKMRSPLRRLSSTNLRIDLASNPASMALLNKHQRLSRIELGLVVGGTIATGAALVVSEPGEHIPVSVVPGVLLVAAAIYPHFHKRRILLEAVRAFNR